MDCSDCGQAVPRNALFCINCGSSRYQRWRYGRHKWCGRRRRLGDRRRWPRLRYHHGYHLRAVAVGCLVLNSYSGMCLAMLATFYLRCPISNFDSNRASRPRPGDALHPQWPGSHQLLDSQQPQNPDLFMVRMYFRSSPAISAAAPRHSRDTHRAVR